MSSTPINDRSLPGSPVRPPLVPHPTSYHSAVSTPDESEGSSDDFVRLSSSESVSATPSRSTTPVPTHPAALALGKPLARIIPTDMTDFSAPVDATPQSAKKPEPSAPEAAKASAAEAAKTSKAEGTKPAEKAKPAANAPTVVAKQAPKNSFEALLDACANAINTVFASIAALFAFATEMATGTAGKVYRGIQTGVNKAKAVFTKTTTSVRNATKTGIQKVRTASAPSTEPAEGRYQRAKAWTKAKVHGLCNWAMNKLG